MHNPYKMMLSWFMPYVLAYMVVSGIAPSYAACCFCLIIRRHQECGEMGKTREATDRCLNVSLFNSTSNIIYIHSSIHTYIEIFANFI